ncbi:MAG: transcription antitermination factor NusB [Bdellovibrionales bacterium]|nr:transcription antitermination factor NusB [Bdellovibrionales bacterium]
MIQTRRLAREIACQALYSMDLRSDWSRSATKDFFDYFFSEASLLSGDGTVSSELRDKQHRDFAIDLVNGVSTYREGLDELLSLVSTRWSIPRMLPVDRNILRLASYELVFLSDIPSNVSINEAIELAKRLGTDDSPTFVNGVLDKVSKIIVAEPQKMTNLFPSLLEKKVENS